MARTWLSITVELLGGRGEVLWPRPGRTFAVGPSHTFAQLGEAIDLGFARWDLGHLRRFDLADGTAITDEETGADLAHPMLGEAVPTLDINRVKVAATVKPGDELRYVFDFGDDWTHRLTVSTEKVDPLETVGVVPEVPTAYFGGGTLPDQYGRRWLDDDGETDPPPAVVEDPMLGFDWPKAAQPDVDVRELRGAVFRGDGDAVVAALRGRNLEPCLQLVGGGIQIVLGQGHPEGRGLAEEVVHQLGARDGVGDVVLREDLRAMLDGTPIVARSLPVDLPELANALEERDSEWGNYLDLVTGDVVPGALTDEAEVGDGFVDIEADPDRYLVLEPGSSREAWQDMAAFVSGLPVGEPRERLDRAIEGRGAFRRFKDQVARVGLLERWRVFAEDRESGRARQFLADHGIRAVPRG